LKEWLPLSRCLSHNTFHLDHKARANLCDTLADMFVRDAFVAHRFADDLQVGHARYRTHLVNPPRCPEEAFKDGSGVVPERASAQRTQ
jgi:hypothetical protein